MAEVRRARWVGFASVALALTGLAAAAYLAARWAATPPEETDPDGEPLPEVVEEEPLPDLGRGERYEKVRAHARDVFESFAGRVDAEGGIPVRALPGQRMAIVAIHKWEGDAVRKGDVLLELNDAEAKKLLAEAEKAGDTEAAKRWRAMVEGARILSPADGFVKEVHGDVGEVPVDVGKPLVTIVDPDAFSFRVVVPQQVVATAGHLGAKLRVDLENGARAEATVTGYDTAPEGSTMLVLGLRAETGLEAGISGTVRVPTTREEVALVPRKAVSKRGEVQIVRVFEPDTKSVGERTILTDGTIGEDVIVTAGVFAGEAVVVPDR